MPRLSPSTLDYYSKCPCFSFKPFDREGSAAEEGTTMHKAFETGDDAELGEEQRRRVEQTRELVEAQKTSYLGWSDSDPVNFRMHHEERMKTSSGLSGRMDRCYVNLKDRKALVFDSKYGRAGLIAEAEDSFQMKNYFDIVMNAYPGLVDEVRCVLGSPRTNEVSIHDFKADDWPRVKAEIDAVIASVENPFKHPTPHDAICSKCTYIDSCPALKPQVLAPVLEKAVALPHQVLLKPVEELTTEEMAQNKAFMDLLSAWIEAREPKIQERVFAERLELPGYTKVRKEGAPFIPVDKIGLAWERMKSNLTPEQFISACGKPSLSKLVETLADDMPGESLAERKEAARVLLFDRLEAEVIQQMKGSEYLRRKAKLDMKLIGG